MISHKVEGTILKSFDFKDHDKIITLFTKEEGIISVIIKNANRPKQKWRSQIEPLVTTELIYKEGKSELKQCLELHTLNPRLKIRDNLATITAAFEILQTVLKTQLQGAQAPLLYQLFNTYLDKLPVVKDPFVLAVSFQLKLLRHEGELPRELTCSTCSQHPTSFAIYEGETFCPRHAPQESIHFDPQETHLFDLLSHCHTFSQITKTELSQTFRKKIALAMHKPRNGS